MCVNIERALDFGSGMRETVFLVRASKNEKPKKTEGKFGEVGI